MTRLPAMLACGVEPSSSPGADRRRRQIEDDRLRGFDRHRSGIDDFEQRKRVQRFVPHFEHETRSIAEHDGAALRGTLGLLTFLLRAFLHVRIGRHERDTGAARRRDGELLRLDPFAVHGRGRLHPRAGL